MLAGTLMLKGNNAYPITVKGSLQPSTVLSATELEGTELLSVHAFAAEHFRSCDELVNNRVRWCQGSLPAAA